MGWPTKGSGKSYNSHTGFGHQIGCYTSMVLYSVILSRHCRTCEIAKVLNIAPRKHVCIKNWDASSKSMEPYGILHLVSTSAEERGFVADWIVSDDDSSMRAIVKHKKSELLSDKGKLPPHIPEPIFKADPSHRVKVVAKYFYLLKKKKVAESIMTGPIAARLKRSWGYMIKQNRCGTIENFLHAAKAPLHHTFNDHRFCGDWCLAIKAQKEKKVFINPRGWLSRDTEEGKKLFEQIQEITTKYGSEFYLRQSLHPFDTQTNEALNYSQSCLTPKCKVFHTSKAFHYRHAITVGCHNWGFRSFGHGYLTS